MIKYVPRPKPVPNPHPTPKPTPTPPLPEPEESDKPFFYEPSTSIAIVRGFETSLHE